MNLFDAMKASPIAAAGQDAISHYVAIEKNSNDLYDIYVTVGSHSDIEDNFASLELAADRIKELSPNIDTEAWKPL